MSTVKVSLGTLVQRIREEFEEAPGLRLTLGEATRFWALDEATCEQVLTELVATGFLAKGPDERYRALSTTGEVRAISIR
jgi:hypothetical protein